MKFFPQFLVIKTPGSRSGSRSAMTKSWIQIRIETNADPQHWPEQMERFDNLKKKAELLEKRKSNYQLNL